MGNVEKVIACFKEIKFSPSVDDFQDRLRVQKINCLLNLGGIKTGFECNLYIRGPYSPDLAHTFFDQKERFANPQSSLELHEHEKKFLAELSSIFNFNASYLEVGSTYAYLTIKCGMSSLDAVKTIKQTKKFFSESQIAIGVSKSKELLSKPSKELIDMVRKEGELWDTAATPLKPQEN